MNPVLILTHNCLEMTKRCVESAQKQDIPTQICIVDNGSSDGTAEWASRNGFRWASFNHNAGVSKGWNIGLELLFVDFPREHVLAINNDVIIPSWFLSSLLSYDVPFVTGVSVGSMEEIAQPEPRKELAPCPDFSAFLIRRECWEKVGPFDETMCLYASDLDYHIRAHRAGVKLMNAGVAFYHERSSTLNSAPPRERRLIELCADADRATFTKKWGCTAWGPAYDAMFTADTFGIDGVKSKSEE